MERFLKADQDTFYRRHRSQIMRKVSVHNVRDMCENLGVSPIRILMVDDSEAIRITMAASLEAEGFTIRTEGTVRAGYEAALSWSPDIVIVDVMMLRADDYSGGGGLQLLRWIKRDLPDVAVVMFTGEERERSRHVAEQLGAAAYLVKGSEMDIIVTTLRMIASARSVHAERKSSTG